MVCWTGADDWKPHCGALWSSPEAMGIPTVKVTKPEIKNYGAEFVLIEQVMVSDNMCFFHSICLLFLDVS